MACAVSMEDDLFLLKDIPHMSSHKFNMKELGSMCRTPEPVSYECMSGFFSVIKSLHIRFIENKKKHI